MAYGIQLLNSSGDVTFDSDTMIGWRFYEAISVGETESSSKDYTGVIPSGYTIQALVMPSVALGGSHTVSVSGYVVSWTYFTISILPPAQRNNPSTILVFYK